MIDLQIQHSKRRQDIRPRCCMQSRCEKIGMVMVDRGFICSKIWPLLDLGGHFQICSGRTIVLLYNTGQITVIYGQLNDVQDLSRHNRNLWGCYWPLALSKTLDVFLPNFRVTSEVSHGKLCRLPWTVHLGILPRWSRVALPTNGRSRWGRWSSTSSVLALQRDASPLYPP